MKVNDKTKVNKIDSILNRISLEKGHSYRLSYGPGYWSEIQIHIYREFLDQHFDTKNTFKVKQINSLDIFILSNLINAICIELKGVKRSHLLEPAMSYIDEDDVFFNVRGHNLRWIIIFVDKLLDDRVKLHHYLEGSLSHNFLLRMENHVKNTQLREGIRERDLYKLKFYDEKLRYKEK